VHIYFISK